MAKFRPNNSSKSPSNPKPVAAKPPLSRSPTPKSTSFSPSKDKQQRQSLPDGLFIVEGIAAITEYLRFKPQSVKKIFAKERQFAALSKELSAYNVRIESVKENESAGDERILPGTPIWAHIHHEMMDWLSFETYLSKLARPNELILALDHISDPRNLGAIIRSAAFFGVTKVIVPERRQVLLTHAGVGTAQGGFALCDLVVVVNLSRALEELKEKGFWILGAAMNGEPVDKIRGRYERQVLVLGSEDKGISSNVLTKCDVHVSIGGSANTLESLNVSVAAGILLQRLIVLP